VNFTPTSTALLLEDAAFRGCVVEGQMEHGHMMVNCADWEPPFSVAVTGTNSSAGGVTLAALTEKVAEDAEDGTVTELGTTIAAPAESATVVPPVGLAAERVTVQVLLAPALSTLGLQVKPVTTMGGISFKVKLCDVPFNEAVTVAV
jgi:hypothetical protein